MKSKIKGDYGENAALGYLEAKGYKVLSTNYKAGGGEIDIIAKDGEYIVFVEVKYRQGNAFGGGFDAITPAKVRRIIKSAKTYLYKQNQWESPCRFDIIEIFGREQLEINHIENAFWED
ncbi:MAG: YraN family protein [Defluviitaleaceae bacterium]|nr:YraN family protein [Defluviitaleaceae bacterium]